MSKNKLRYSLVCVLLMLSACARQRVSDVDTGPHTKPIARDTTTPVPKKQIIRVRSWRGSPWTMVVGWDTYDGGDVGLRSAINHKGELVHDHVIWLNRLFLSNGESFSFAAIDSHQLVMEGGAFDADRCLYGMPCTPAQTIGARIPDEMLRGSSDSINVTFFGGAVTPNMVLTLRREFLDAYLKTVDSVRASIREMAIAHDSVFEPIHLAGPPRTKQERSLPLVYWSEVHADADTEAVHVLRVDLHSHAIEVDVVMGDDPDGNGPAEAELTDPLVLAKRANVLAAVNANAFAGMPDSTGKRDSHWHVQQPVEIQGVAIHDGVARSSGPQKGAPDVAFGVDRKNKVYVGQAAGTTSLEEAVNAWAFTMLQDGKPVPQEGGPRHPRTAVGVDESGRWLYMVVVDGRQPGYSVGMTALELANLMLRIGAVRAINLDGGGSSILLVSSRDGALHIVNKPSGGSPRPVPVMLTVRRRMK